MKVSSTELPARQVSLAIEVEQARLDLAIEEAFRRLAGRIDVPGFRRGKAPRSMVERMVGRDRIMEDALDRLVPQVVTEAIEQEKVDPYTRPRVESIEFDPLRVKAVVGLAPRVELGDYKGTLRVASEQAKVDDDQIEAVIQRLRESHSQWAPVERPVKLGDRVGLDVHAVAEGREQPLHDDREAEFIVDEAVSRPAPGFAHELLGMSAGESRSFTLTLPDDYHIKELAGAPAKFNVTLHWVKERELPELDDEFAQQVGEFADMVALRSSIEAQLRQREEERVREQLEDAAMSKLVEMSSIEFPPQLVDYQAQHMMDTFSRNVEQQGLQLQQYLRLVGKEQETFEQEIRVEAESRVRRSLALDAFAKAEQIAVEQAEDGSREREAMARLLELATGSGRSNGDKPGSGTQRTTERLETSDTERQTPEAHAAVAPTAKEG